MIVIIIVIVIIKAINVINISRRRVIETQAFKFTCAHKIVKNGSP